jgi:manganese/zinc/iron transport system permease protein
MTPTLGQFVWLPLDTWIVVVGAMSAASCALLGSYLVLRRMSMMGDAISHAVLPGLALAFLLTGSRDSVIMLVGAGVVGVLTAVFTQWVHAVGRVDQGASMGVVFTILFAIGLILIRQTADTVDLDPGCVLYGAIETVPLNTVVVAGWAVPQAALAVGAVLLLNLLFVGLLYKELKLSTFDPALATTLGINARLMHYLLMMMVAVTTVSAFESVGSILVIAMLIVPAATAHLLTDRLGVLLVLSVLFGVASAGLGHLAAILSPGWFGFGEISTSTAGMMAVVAGVLFLVALLAAPRYGLISRALNRAALTIRIIREDTLGLLYRIEELEPERGAADLLRMLTDVGGRPLLNRVAVAELGRRGLVRRDAGVYRLTERGRSSARQLVRTHRLWETYLTQHLGLAADAVHAPAERLEHVTSDELRRRLAESTDFPTVDPHSKRIPSLDGWTRPEDAS